MQCGIQDVEAVEVDIDHHVTRQRTEPGTIGNRGIDRVAQDQTERLLRLASV
ncbi:hypothetical protein ACFSVK_07700 [Azorhizophilus paspali]|uniref:hypothetical protein n=1 Tax=Azorhizophilus paspali TaxID=69963 RepID=UPI00363F4576